MREREKKVHQRRKRGVGKLKDLLSVTGFGKKGKIEIDECINSTRAVGWWMCDQSCGQISTG